MHSYYYAFVGICTYSLLPLVQAQSPFISFSSYVNIGQSANVSWDISLFTNDSVNLAIRETTASINTPLGYALTGGEMTWIAAANIDPGWYYYRLQNSDQTGIVYQSDTFQILKAGVTPTASITPVSSTQGSATGISTSSSTTTAASSNSLSAGAAAGIGIGAAALVLFVGLGIFLFYRRTRKKHQNSMGETHAELPNTEGAQEVEYSPAAQNPSGTLSNIPSPSWSAGRKRYYSHELEGSLASPIPGTDMSSQPSPRPDTLQSFGSQELHGGVPKSPRTPY
ncbi:MAG: hypothetical protein M1834_004875 [Cirrosporium novae-zelandiae]|nr:MAG: hypothetical protein M1834_004875 [Cirrosporium novae-zelandiae]